MWFSFRSTSSLIKKNICLQTFRRFLSNYTNEKNSEKIVSNGEVNDRTYQKNLFKLNILAFITIQVCTIIFFRTVTSDLDEVIQGIHLLNEKRGLEIIRLQLDIQELKTTLHFLNEDIKSLKHEYSQHSKSSSNQTPNIENM